MQYLFINPEYDLQRDEYLHLDQANHLAWGYLSVPPFTSWTSYLIQLLGNGIFWVKFFPALYGALTILVIWKTIELFSSHLFALVLGATCVLLSVVMRMNMLYQPNSFDILAWTMLYYTCIKYIKTSEVKWLYTAALVFALGFLNKYNILFLVLGLVPALLLTTARSLFSNKHLYYAAALALLLISPNLVWQYTHHFPIVKHMKELSDTQLVNVHRTDFLKAQLLFFSGSMVVIVAALAALLAYVPFTPYRFLFWSFLFTLVIFMYFKAKDYYAIGVYPIYIGLGAAYLTNLLAERKGKWWQPMLMAIPLFCFIPMYLVAFPYKSPSQIVANPGAYKAFGLLRWEDGKDHALPQDFADMLGWRELAQKVDSIYMLLPVNENTLVLCDNYGQAGAINYYSRHHVRAVSFNADYIHWFDLSKSYTNLIRVKEAEERDAEMKETAPFFETALVADSITNTFAREHGTAIFLFRGAKVNVNTRIEMEINEKKN